MATSSSSHRHQAHSALGSSSSSSHQQPQSHPAHVHPTIPLIQDEYEPFSENTCCSKLRAVGRSSEQIRGMAAWIFHHRNHLTHFVKIWIAEFKKAPPSRRLTMYYVAHETLALCKKKRFDKAFQVFQSVLREATAYSRDKECKVGVRKVFHIFKEANFFSEDFLKQLHDDLEKGRSTTNQNKILLIDYDPGVISKIHEQMEDFRENTLQKAEKNYKENKQDLDYGDHVIAKIKEHDVGKEHLARFDNAFAGMRELEDARDQDLQHEYDLLNQLELLRIFYSTTSKEAEKVIVAYGNYETVAKNGMKHLENSQNLLSIPLPNATNMGSSSSPSHEASTDIAEVVDMDLSDDENQNDTVKDKIDSNEIKMPEKTPQVTAAEGVDDDEPYSPPDFTTSPRVSSVPFSVSTASTLTAVSTSISAATNAQKTTDSFTALLSSLPMAPINSLPVPPSNPQNQALPLNAVPFPAVSMQQPMPIDVYGMNSGHSVPFPREPQAHFSHFPDSRDILSVSSPNVGHSFDGQMQQHPDTFHGGSPFHLQTQQINSSGRPPLLNSTPQTSSAQPLLNSPSGFNNEASPFFAQGNSGSLLGRGPGSGFPNTFEPARPMYPQQPMHSFSPTGPSVPLLVSPQMNIGERPRFNQNHHFGGFDQQNQGPRSYAPFPGSGNSSNSNNRFSPPFAISQPQNNHQTNFQTPPQIRQLLSTPTSPRFRPASGMSNSPTNNFMKSDRYSPSSSPNLPTSPLPFNTSLLSPPPRSGGPGFRQDSNVRIPTVSSRFASPVAGPNFNMSVSSPRMNSNQERLSDRQEPSSPAPQGGHSIPSLSTRPMISARFGSFDRQTAPQPSMRNSFNDPKRFDIEPDEEFVHEKDGAKRWKGVETPVRDHRSSNGPRFSGPTATGSNLIPIVTVPRSPIVAYEANAPMNSHSFTSDEPAIGGGAESGQSGSSLKDRLLRLAHGNMG